MYLYEDVYVANWIIGIVCFLVSLYCYTTYKQSRFRWSGIKGPKPMPFMGNLGLFDKEGFANIDTKLREQYGDVFVTYIGNVHELVITDPEMIKEITVRQFSKFYDRYPVITLPKRWKNSLNNATGTYWKFLRFVIGPTFSSQKMKNMRSLIEKCTDELVCAVNDKIDASDDSVIDMYKPLTALTMDVICRTAFGIEVNSQRNPDDAFVKHAANVLGATLKTPAIFANLLFPELGPLIMFIAGDFVKSKSMSFLTAAVQRVIKERRESESDSHTDFVTLLLNSKRETQGKLSDLMDENERSTFEEYKAKGLLDDEIIMNGIIFLAAGYETTSSLLSSVAYCLALNPEYQDRLIDEIDSTVGTREIKPSYDQIMNMTYLDMVISETLRLYAPAVRVNRESACDVDINGLFIPKGTNITLAIHAMHKNPKYWPEPLKFDPERFSVENKQNIVPYTYIPFGAGPRNCVGMKLALLEAKMTTVRLLQHFKFERSDKTEVPLNLGKGNLIKPVNGQWLKVIKR